MQYSRNGTIILIRFDRGEEIPGSIIKFCQEHHISSGVCSGIGAVSDPILSYYDLSTSSYQDREFIGSFELCALSGNITLIDNKPMVHAHVVLANKHFTTIAGHLIQATVHLTLELQLNVFDGAVGRRYDTMTGLKLLDL